MNTYIKSHKRRKSYNRYFFILFPISILLSTCQPPTYHTKPPPGPTAFPIVNIFALCHNPLTSTKTLAYKLVLTTYYNWNGGRDQFDQVSYTSDQINPSPNITITANIPRIGNWSCDISVVSTQCSTCTAYWLSSPCAQSNGNNGIIAGVPTLFLGGSPTNGYNANQPQPINMAINLSSAPNASCGCTVPYN